MAERQFFSRIGISTGGRGRVNVETWYVPGGQKYRLAFWNSDIKQFVVIYEAEQIFPDFEAMLVDAHENLRCFLRDNKGDLKKIKGPEHL